MKTKYFFGLFSVITLLTAGCRDSFNPVPSEPVSSISIPGLVAYYPFDGTADDKSGNNYHGQVHEALLTTDRFGSPGKAYNFDGMDDYISVPKLSGSKLEPKDAITISCFIKAKTSASAYPWSRILSKAANYDDGYALSWNQSNNFVLEMMLGYDSKPETYTTPMDRQGISNTPLIGEWHHIAITYSRLSRVLFFYVDGDLISKKENCNYQMEHSCDTMYIGGNNGLWDTGGNWATHAFPGAIDDIRIYDRDLNQSEILELYHEGGYNPVSFGDFEKLTAPGNGLLAYFPFNRNADDKSGNNHNGTVNYGNLTSNRKGRPNSAYAFDGTINGIDVPHDPNFNTFPKSFSFWIKSEEVNPNVWIMGKTFLPLEDGYAMYFQDGRLKFVIFRNGVNTTAVNAVYPQDLDWHHIAIVATSTRLRIYVDGVTDQEDGPGFTAGSINNTNNFTLGYVAGYNITPFLGKLDEVRIYNRLLSAAEVKLLAE